MSDQILHALQTLFISLQEELLKSCAFNNLLSTLKEKVEDNGSGAYLYQIPFRDEKGLLILTYENADEGFTENNFKFQFRQFIPPNHAECYLTAEKELEIWLEQEGTVCQWGYEQDDAKAWIQVETSLTKSWKGPSSNKLEELAECVKEAWGVLEKWKAVARDL